MHKRFSLLVSALAMIAGTSFQLSAAEEPRPAVRTALFPIHEVVISARVDSVLCPTPLRIGSSFKSGDVLLKLDPSRYQIEERRCSQLCDFAKSQYEDKKELRKKDFTSDFELEKAKHDFTMASCSLEEARLNLSFCTITAPFDGKIADFTTREFETVRPGQPLLRIIDDHELLAVVNPPLNWGSRKKIGDVVRLKLSDDRIVVGSVYEIAPAADNRTETLRLRIKIDNREGKLCAGMTGELLYGD